MQENLQALSLWKGIINIHYVNQLTHQLYLFMKEWENNFTMKKRESNYIYFSKIFYFILLLIYNVMLVLLVQQRDPVIHTHTHANIYIYMYTHISPFFFGFFSHIRTLHILTWVFHYSCRNNRQLLDVQKVLTLS